MREVAAPQRLRGVERRVMAQRRERVLQRRALARVRVDVAGRHRRHAQPGGQIGQRAVARAVVALERPLELDPQAVAPEGPQQPPQRRLVVHPAQGAAAQAHQALGVLLERRQRQLGRDVDPPHPRPDQRLPAPVAGPPGRTVLDRLVDRPARVRVRAGEQVAEVAPAALVLDQQRQVPAVLEIHLRPVDRPQPERRGGLHELHRARDAVVVGERHRLVAELGRGGGQLVGERGAVQEGEGRVGVKLDVHEHMFAYGTDGRPRGPAHPAENVSERPLLGSPSRRPRREAVQPSRRAGPVVMVGRGRSEGSDGRPRRRRRGMPPGASGRPGWPPRPGGARTARGRDVAGWTRAARGARSASSAASAWAEGVSAQLRRPACAVARSRWAPPSRARGLRRGPPLGAGGSWPNLPARPSRDPGRNPRAS